MAEINGSPSTFLSAFFPDPEEPIHLRALPPRGARGEVEKFTLTRRELESATVIEKLERLNRVRGLYFVVNAGGDTDDSITRFNAVFGECDDILIAEQHALYDAAPIPPSIRVETKKSVHAYWPLCGDCTAEQWRAVQRGLISRFKSDPKIKNPSRPMRLPFFNHLSVNGDGKIVYTPVKLVEFHPERRYTVEEMLAAFPEPESRTASNHTQPKTDGRYATWSELNAELRRRMLGHSTCEIKGEWAHLKGVCHDGRGDTALAVHLPSGAFKCMNDCDTAAILRAFGLPERPDANSGRRTMNNAVEPEADEVESEVADDRSKRTTQAQLLIQLAESQAEFFHTVEYEAYADVQINGHRETWPLRSKAFRRWLLRIFYNLQGKPPAAQSLQDALGVIEAKARFDSVEREVSVRVGEHGGNIYIDLCDANWQAIEITCGGWRVVVDPPVRFRRARGMLPVPVPVAGGKLSELRRFINVASDADFVLILAWLLAALRPKGPYPVLELHGEQGSAKSTASRLLRDLVDPNTAALRSEPREARDLMIAANNAWCMAYDNLSHLPAWLSDAFCRLSTGGGFSTRELYSDVDEIIFDSQRPVLLNGIAELATRGDLLDRSIILYLPTIPEQKRRPETDFWSEFEKAKPEILGAVLDAVSTAMRNLESVKLESLPRMADFALWSVAAEEAIGSEPGTFMSVYSRNRESANELTLEASPVAAVVRELAESGEWTGIASELLNELSERADEKTQRQKGWPKTARALSNTLRRLAPNLRAIGVAVEFNRIGGKNSRRTITLRKVTKSSVTSVIASPGIENERVTGDANGGGDANTVTDDLFASPHNFNSINGSDDGDDGDAKIRGFSENDSPDDCYVCQVFQERGDHLGCFVHFPEGEVADVPFRTLSSDDSVS
jgi:hypothetical protein